MRNLKLGSIALLLAAAIAPAGATDAARPADTPQPGKPALQLGDSRFPELLMHVRQFDAHGNPVSMACDQIRPRRIDELDPAWKVVVERIHLECEPVPPLEDGESKSIATVVTAYLRPGSAVFLHAPVVEVRQMDSNYWSDHQYVLATPYAEFVDALQQHLVARCEAETVDGAILSRRSCAVTRNADGMFVANEAVSGVWAYPDPFDERRTVYAQGWAE